MRISIFAAFPLMAAGALGAQEASAELPTRANVQTIPFASGGLIRVNGSYGDLVVEGSDQPDVEIEMTKSLEYGVTKQDKERLARVKILTERPSDSELSISIIAPSPNRLFRPLGSKGGGVSLEMHIRAPRGSRLAIHHGVGMVTVSDVIGDLDVDVSRGDILVELPDGRPDMIEARTNLGVVSSDFSGSPKLRLYRMGERFTAQVPIPSQRVHLRMGFGGITIKRLPSESLPSL